MISLSLIKVHASRVLARSRSRRRKNEVDVGWPNKWLDTLLRIKLTLDMHIARLHTFVPASSRRLSARTRHRNVLPANDTEDPLYPCLNSKGRSFREGYAPPTRVAVLRSPWDTRNRKEEEEEKKEEKILRHLCASLCTCLSLIGFRVARNMCMRVCRLSFSSLPVRIRLLWEFFLLIPRFLERLCPMNCLQGWWTASILRHLLFNVLAFWCSIGIHLISKKRSNGIGLWKKKDRMIMIWKILNELGWWCMMYAIIEDKKLDGLIVIWK